jgi:hypothetical protein
VPGRPGNPGAVAQLVAHHTGSVGVRGSSPLGSTLILHAKSTDSPARGGSRGLFCLLGLRGRLNATGEREVAVDGAREYV